MQPQEFSRVIFPETRFDFDSLKAIGLFCGAGLAGSPGRLRPRFESRLPPEERPKINVGDAASSRATAEA